MLITSNLNPNREYLLKILTQCPEEWTNNVLAKYRPNETNYGSNTNQSSSYNERVLSRLHRNIKQASQQRHRTKVQWEMIILQAYQWEDVVINSRNSEHKFRSFTANRNADNVIMGWWYDFLYTPGVEWFWKCLVRPKVFLFLSLLAATMSIITFWCQMTFSFYSLSVLAIFRELISASRNYFLLEV